MGVTAEGRIDLTASHCSGACDDEVAACFCAAHTRYGRREAPPGSPPGTPPLSRGRPTFDRYQPSSDAAGRPSVWGDVPAADIDDWCENDEPNFHCPCMHDGMGGKLCDRPFQATCVNQCNGHGECMTGFCFCDDGWYGHDCAYRRAGVPWAPGREAWQPWINDTMHTPAAWDVEMREGGEAMAATGVQKPPSPGDVTHSPANSTATVHSAPTKPIMAPRRRPLIYVYELPSEFNTRMVQYALGLDACRPRTFNWENDIHFKNTVLRNHPSHEYQLALDTSYSSVCVLEPPSLR